MSPRQLGRVPPPDVHLVQEELPENHWGVAILHHLEALQGVVVAEVLGLPRVAEAHLLPFLVDFVNEGGRRLKPAGSRRLDRGGMICNEQLVVGVLRRLRVREVESWPLQNPLQVLLEISLERLLLVVLGLDVHDLRALLRTSIARATVKTSPAGSSYTKT